MGTTGTLARMGNQIFVVVRQKLLCIMIKTLLSCAIHSWYRVHQVQGTIRSCCKRKQIPVIRGAPVYRTHEQNGCGAAVSYIAQQEYTLLLSYYMVITSIYDTDTRTCVPGYDTYVHTTKNNRPRDEPG